MRILVLGAGAVGGYYGARLLEAGADVTFLVRPKRAAQLAERGIVVKSALGDVQRPAKVLTEAETAFDVVIVACKSFDLDSALDAVAPAVGSQTGVLPLLNGVAHLDTIAARFGAHRAMGGCAYISTALQPSGDIQHFDRMDMIQFGELDGTRSARLDALAGLFAKTKSTASAIANILQSLWDKWMTLAGTGTALTLIRGTVGDVLDAPSGPEFIRTIFDECGAVATAYGYPPSPSVLAFVATASQRRGFMTSMARDLIEGRRTEADHIIGDLVRRAETKGVPVPTLRAALVTLQVHEARMRR